MLLELMFDNVVHSLVELVLVQMKSHGHFIVFEASLKLTVSNCHGELNHWNKVLRFVFAYSTYIKLLWVL